MTKPFKWFTRSAVAVGVAALAAFSLVTLGSGPSSAQACPYPFTSCPTVPPVTPPPLRLFLNFNVVVAGQPIHIFLCGAPNGLKLRFTFDGITLGSATATNTPPRPCNAGQAALAKRAAPRGVFAAINPFAQLTKHRADVVAQTAPYDAYVDVTYNVPDLPPGVYPLCALPAGFDAVCADVRIVPKGSVLAAQFQNPANPAGGANSVTGTGGAVSANRPATSGSGILAFTGMGLLRLVVLAAALVLAGWLLVRRSRRHQRLRQT